MPEQQNPALRIEQVSLDHLRAIAESGELYAVADATDAPAVPRKVLELGPARAVSLYRGTAEEEFWDVAPYLLHLDPPVLDWIVSTLDVKRWGIFAVSKANLDTLRTHFRHFLKVQPPEGEPWHFRFYDPRVFRPFLPACSVEELRIFFGPLRVFGVLTSEAVLLHCERGAPPVPYQPRQSGESPFLQLRPQHLEALRPQAEAAFAHQICQFLRDDHPSLLEGLSDEVIFRRVLAGIGRARRYNFTLESSIASFVAIMFTVAPNFDEQPSIRAALMDASVAPDLRIGRFRERTLEKDWEDARAGANDRAWT